MSTDNAYVHADVVQITPRIAGTVDALFVNDNQPVVAGDLVVRLDPADPALGLQQAEATLANATQEVEQARPAVRATLGIPLDAPATEAAVVRQAQAARDQAALLLSYTELRAPTAGVVAKWWRNGWYKWASACNQVSHSWPSSRSTPPTSKPTSRRRS